MKFKTIYLEPINKYTYIPIAVLFDEDIIPINQLLQYTDDTGEDNLFIEELISCRMDNGEVVYFLTAKYKDSNKYIIEDEDVTFSINTDGAYDAYFEKLQVATDTYLEANPEAYSTAITYNEIGETFIKIISPDDLERYRNHIENQIVSTKLDKPELDKEESPRNIDDEIEIDIDSMDMDSLISEFLNNDNKSFNDKSSYSDVEEAESMQQESIQQGKELRNDIQKEKTRLTKYADSIKDVIAQSKRTDNIIKRNENLVNNLTKKDSDTDNLIESFIAKTKTFAQLVDSIPIPKIDSGLKTNTDPNVDMLNKVLIEGTASTQYNITEKSPKRKSSTEELESVLSEANNDVEEASKALEQANEIVNDLKALKTVDYLSNKKETVYTRTELLEKLQNIKLTLAGKKASIEDQRSAFGEIDETQEESSDVFVRSNPFNLLNTTIKDAKDISAETQSTYSTPMSLSKPQPTPNQPNTDNTKVDSNNPSEFNTNSNNPSESSEFKIDSNEPSESKMNSNEPSESKMNSNEPSEFKIDLSSFELNDDKETNNNEEESIIDLMNILEEPKNDLDMNIYEKQDEEIILSSPTIGQNVDNTSERNTITISGSMAKSSISMLQAGMSTSDTDFEDE